MKKIFVFTIALSVAICSSCCFEHAEVKRGVVDLLTITIPVNYQLDKTWTELDVKLDIKSGFNDDACIIVRLEKIYRPYYTIELPAILGGFKDSLKIDGFHVRAYRVLEDGFTNINDVATIIDFPVYIKNIYINKGNNQENFKIVFSKSVSANVYVYIEVVRFNDELKSKYEAWNGKINNEYFKTFPDSSMTSYIFANSSLFRNLSILDQGEAGTINSKCPRYSYVPLYYNYDCISFSL